jgi:uncharacterized protein (DUF427 family)
VVLRRAAGWSTDNTSEGDRVMKATLDGVVIAESDDVVTIEGNAYFPPQAVRPGVLAESPTPYTCPWKGVCQYFNVRTESGSADDRAWSYPNPPASAIERVGRDFSDYVAFAPSITVSA